MTNPRVLHIIDTAGPGGAETVFLHLVSGLAARGWTAVPLLPKDDWLADALRAAGHTPTFLRNNHALDVPYLLELRRILSKNRIDIVQAHLLGSAVYSTLACLGGPIPVVATFHGRPDITPDMRFRRWKTRLLERERNRIVCVSRSLRDHFVSTGDVRTRATVIPNGVDLGPLRSAAPAPIREELGIGPGAPLIGTVGNIRPSKAHDILIRAFSRVRAVLPEAHLVIAGHYEEHDSLFTDLRGLIEELGLVGSAHFLGFREDVPGILRAMDLFALSSRDEGFSLATVQALGVGVPTVLTRCGGPEEIVGESGGALFVQPDDDEALADAVVALLGSSADRKERMVSAGRRRVSDLYSLESMVDAYEGVYREVLG